MLLCAAAAAAPGADVRAQHQRAERLVAAGQLADALRAIDDGLALAPRHVGLLFLKGSALFRLHRYAAALDAYEAYLAAGASGQNRRTVSKIVEELRPVRTTFLDISFTGERADVYLQSKTWGVWCAAARPTCLEAVLPGSYDVVAERAGYERWTSRVVVERDRTAKLAIALVELPSRLTVRTTPAGARIAVDDQPYDAAAPLPAGPHRVSVELAGHEPVRVDVTAHEGTPIDLDLALAPTRAAPPAVATPSAHPPPAAGRFTTRRKLALAAGGVGVVALGAAAILGVRSSRLEAGAFARCPSPSVPCADAAAASELTRRGHVRALQADAAFGVAGAAAVTAAVLWLTGAPESRRVSSSTPRRSASLRAPAEPWLAIAPHGTGLVVAVSF